MALKVGNRLGTYEVRALLGAGGMGEVYRATDTRLGRDVALKVLPARLATDPERRARFAREARVLAALNHPHIAAIYGLEDTGSPSALVLELVDGPTLAERLASRAASGERGLPESEALEIARQVADGLDAAHEKGIVHRDLKPANIKLTTGGVVKVLDFGLAKMLTTEPGVSIAAELTTLTNAGSRAGLMLGTPAYLSPEQARGQPVDNRTDIWAFGCVLYELLTGHAPFAGRTLTDTLVAILERQPDWSVLPGRTPPVVRHLLARCLERDVKHRLRDIGEARAILGDLTIGAHGAARGGADHPVESVAVMPFATSSSTPDAEYLSDGITESVINALAGLPDLKVMARSTVFRHKGEDPLRTGLDLGVARVVTGRVFQRGETLIIGAELVDVASGSAAVGTAVPAAVGRHLRYPGGDLPGDLGGAAAEAHPRRPRAVRPARHG